MAKNLNLMEKKETVVLGLSGGVDSSVAAILLKKKGFSVIGAFMKNFSDAKNPYTGECSYLEEKKMAQKIASILGIPFVVFDFEKQYKKNVIGPMYTEYEKGLTPNPDILCNKLIKFPLFWNEAKKLGADFMAMGHYARITKSSGGYNLLAGKDNSKDQSYFLACLNQKDLSHTLFPLGDLTKKKVRKIAKKHGLPNWNRHGTVGICFVGKVKMPSFLGKKIKKNHGLVKDPEGKVLGTHTGLSFCTVGQRAGGHAGIKIIKPKKYAQKRFYVVEKQKPNTLIVAPDSHPATKKQDIIINKFHQINPAEKIPSALDARIRHLGPLHKGILKKKGIKYLFRFNRPLNAVASGQIIALYEKDRVVASGEIRIV